MNVMSFPVLGRFFSNGYGKCQVNYTQISHVLKTANYIGFRVNHFFILPNPVDCEAEQLKLDTCLKKWTKSLIVKVRRLTTEQKFAIKECNVVNERTETHRLRTTTAARIQNSTNNISSITAASSHEVFSATSTENPVDLTPEELSSSFDLSGKPICSVDAEVTYGSSIYQLDIEKQVWCHFPHRIVCFDGRVVVVR
jgi:hypothetical protein